MKKTFLLLLFCLILSSCKSDNYNVYFYNSDMDESFLGTVTGLDKCGEVAWSYAHSKNLERGEWSYICCLKTRSSSCAEKHR